MVLTCGSYGKLGEAPAKFAPFQIVAKGGRHVVIKRIVNCRAYSHKNPLPQVVVAAKNIAAAGMLSLGLLLLSPSNPADARLNSPNASIARTVDAALRRSIPASNQEVRNVQRALEDISFKLRIPQRKPWQQMTDDIVKATKIMVDDQKVLVGVPAGMEERALSLAGNIRAGLIRVNAAIDAKDADKVSIRTGDTLASVAQLELLQAPGLAFSVPRELQKYPRLTGRATVEVTFERGGDQAFVGREGGGGKPQGQIRIEVDGYSAPLTSGNFVANVTSGAYDGSQLAIGGETVSVTSSKLPARVLPMEMLALGQFEPLYRSPLDVQNGELPVLPLSIYGAVAMAHPGPDVSDGASASNEFFLYKFDKASSGLAGLSFEEGNFSVFGYVTGGLEYIPQLQAGDTILNARLIAGAERLIMPETKPAE